MTAELSGLLAAAGLTSLRLVRRAQSFDLELAHEWDDDLDFSGYPDRFGPCRKTRRLGDDEARAWMAERNQTERIAEIQAWMKAGRHEMIVLFVHDRLGIRVCHHIHSSRLGRDNGFHAVRAGGTRFHSPEADEMDVLRDGLNLARAMSFKCAAAEMPFGGSKSSVQAAPIAPDDAERVGFLAWCIDAGQLMTGPDVGLGGELIDAIARRTPNILCGASSPLGSTGAPTADGVHAALCAGAAHRWGTQSLAGLRVAIQGLGAVGLELAARLSADGASVVAADPDPKRGEMARALVSTLELVSPSDILGVECDVLCPCALGAALDRERIDSLHAALVYGAANNQLDAFTSEEELALADRLAERGILFQPDWTYTLGGILTGYEEYRKREAASAAQVRADIARFAGDGTHGLLEAARETGKTPTRIAIERFFPLVHGVSLDSTLAGSSDV